MGKKIQIGLGNIKPQKKYKIIYDNTEEGNPFTEVIKVSCGCISTTHNADQIKVVFDILPVPKHLQKYNINKSVVLKHEDGTNTNIVINGEVTK